jgi:hypothetical protein
VPDQAENRPPDFDDLDLFTQPGETRDLAIMRK